MKREQPIRDRIMELGLIQAHVADALSISESHMCRIALGRVIPQGREFRHKLAKILKTTQKVLWPQT